MLQPSHKKIDAMATDEPVLDWLEKRLLNDFQREFPLSPPPYSEMAASLGVTESEVIDALKHLRKTGAVSRVGPVFRPNSIGSSTLAAMAVPEERLADVAALVNGFPEVNHNYERAHGFNLWFVVAAADQRGIDAVVERIRNQSGLDVMVLPMLEAYHVDLGFRIWDENNDASENLRPPAGHSETGWSGGREGNGVSTADRHLIAAIQEGIPLVPRPYALIGQQTGMPESQVIARIADLVERGIIKRMGVVVRHHELGYRANGMVVWDVPDDRVAELGRCLARYGFVTLCYRRPRRLPDWPYNLFCMIHGRDQGEVLRRRDQIVRECELGAIDHEVLFSVRRFKQCGARYVNTAVAAGGDAA